MTKDEKTEVKCEACNGTGLLQPRDREPGRRIYPGRCAKCGGKGRIPRAE
jgi:DnaJ-class molecular chaperone